MYKLDDGILQHTHHDHYRMLYRILALKQKPTVLQTIVNVLYADKSAYFNISLKESPILRNHFFQGFL